MKFGRRVKIQSFWGEVKFLTNNIPVRNYIKVLIISGCCANDNYTAIIRELSNRKEYFMGLLDDLSGQLGGLMGGSGQGDLIDSAIKLLGGGNGLNGLVQMFNQAGLGEQVQSWIGKGENLPVSADQIKSAFSGDTLNSLAQTLGINAGGAADMLANFLPGVVDQLTPNGKIE